MKRFIDLTSKSNEAPEVDEAELDEWIAKAPEFNNVTFQKLIYRNWGRPRQTVLYLC